MKALVLTFDKYKPFAQHMIMCYEELWPNNPFTFRIPYQSDEVKKDYLQKFGDRVELIKSPSGIVDTMFALSDDLPEDEWVYWCMDDRYPMEISIGGIEKCKRYIESIKGKDIDGLMFCNNPRIWLPKNNYGCRFKIRTKERQTYYRRKNYTMIWNHQFLRVRIIRTFFGLFPRVMKQAKDMDFIKDRAVLPENHKLYVLDHNIAIYGESTNRGVMTKNCVDSFLNKKLPLPKGFKVSNQIIVKGTNTKWDNLIFLFKMFLTGNINKK